MLDQDIHAVVFRGPRSQQWVGLCLEYDLVTQGDKARSSCLSPLLLSNPASRACLLHLGARLRGHTIDHFQ